MKKEFFSFDNRSATAIADAQCLFQTDSIRADFACIFTHFKTLPLTIEALERPGRPFEQSLQILRKLQANLKASLARTAQTYNDKLHKVEKKTSRTGIFVQSRMSLAASERKWSKDLVLQERFASSMLQLIAVRPKKSFSRLKKCSLTGAA